MTAASHQFLDTPCCAVAASERNRVVGAAPQNLVRHGYHVQIERTGLAVADPGHRQLVTSATASRSCAATIGGPAAQAARLQRRGTTSRWK